MKRLTLIAFTAVSFSLQGCFEIVEQMLVKNDGSGTFQLVVNMSKSKTRVASVMKMKTVNGRKVPGKNEIVEKVADIEHAVRSTPGLNQVKTTLDFDNFIATLSCNFEKTGDINNGIRNIAENEKHKGQIDDTYHYDPGPGIFRRLHRFILADDYRKMSKADRDIFATATYTSIFRFEREVASISNKQAKLSANKKAVMLKLNAVEILTNKRTVENQINLSK